VKFAPKLRGLCNRKEGDINHERGKVVQTNSEVLWRPLRVLVMLVTQFTCQPARHFGYKHPIQIHQSEVPVLDHDVPMLKIAMGDAGVLQRFDYL
jgi:hypothetical protein